MATNAGTESLTELKKQREELDKKIDQRIKDERVGVVADVIEKIKAYDITAAELRSALPTKKAAKGKSKAKKAVTPRKTYTDAEKAKAVKMFNDGKTQADIKKEMGVSPATLKKWVEAAK